MSRHLVALFVAFQALDLVTYLQAPHLEANPVLAALPPAGVAIAKLGGVCLALVVVSRIRTPWIQSLGLALGIAIGAFGVGANVASLSIVAAAEAPRSAPEPAPIRDERTGFEQGPVPAAPGRTAAPSTSAAGSPVPSPATDTRVAPVREVPDRKPSGTTTPVRTPRPVVPRGTSGDALHGRATWFAAPDGTAAAGPALRRALGRDWRGSRVTVCAGDRCIRVVLADWCACGRRGGEPTVIDLSDGAFRELAPLSRGVIRVRVVVP